jgi:hypothetical protein
MEHYIFWNTCPLRRENYGLYGGGLQLHYKDPTRSLHVQRDWLIYGWWVGGWVGCFPELWQWELFQAINQKTRYMILTYILVGEQCRIVIASLVEGRKEGSCTNNSISPHFLSDKESVVVSVDCAVRSPHKVQGTIFFGLLLLLYQQNCRGLSRTWSPLWRGCTTWNWWLSRHNKWVLLSLILSHYLPPPPHLPLPSFL